MTAISKQEEIKRLAAIIDSQINFTMIAKLDKKLVEVVTDFGVKLKSGSEPGVHRSEIKQEAIDFITSH